MEAGAETAVHRVGPLSRAFAWAVVRLRFLIVPAWIAAAVAATLALPALSQGGASAGIEPSHSQAGAVEARSTRLFGAPLVSRTLVVQHDARGLSAAAQRRAVQRAGRVHDQALPGLAGVLPLVNRTTALSYLLFAPDASLDDQDSTAHAFAAHEINRPDDALVGVTGTAPARAAQWDEITNALPWVTLATVGLISLVVGLRFLAFGAPLVCLGTAAIAYLVAVRLVAWLGRRAGVAVPQEIEPVMVVLVLGVVTDYAIFFLSGMRRRLGDGQPRVQAAQGSARSNVPIVFTAGILVAACSGALVFGRSDFFRGFGPGLAVSALVAMVVSLTFVPALLAMLGRGAFWPLGPGKPAPAPADATDGWRFRLGRLATARPVALVIVVLCVGALGIAASGVRQLHLGFPLMRDLPASSEPNCADAAASKGFAPGIVSPTELLVQAPGVGRRLPALSRLRAELARRRGVAAVIGPGETRKPVPPGVLVSREGNAARYAIVLRVDPLGATGIRTVRGIREDLPALLRSAGLPGARAGLAGDSALGAETIDRMVTDLYRVGLAALAATFLILALFLRAIRAAAVLLLASVLALAASLGLTTFVFVRLLGYDGLSWYVPFTVAVLLVALGSDYNVFVTGRVWQQAREMPLRDAIALAAPRAARAIIVAGVTLALSFAALALVPLRSFRELAFALACGVLLETFLVRSVLVPSLLALVRPRVGVSEREPIGSGPEPVEPYSTR